MLFGDKMQLGGKKRGASELERRRQACYTTGGKQEEGEACQ